MDRRIRFAGKGEGESTGGGCKPSPAQPRPQQIARPRQPALDCPDRPFESARGFFMRLTFEIAQHNRPSVFRWEPAEFLVENLSELATGERGRESGRFDFAGKRHET